MIGWLIFAPSRTRSEYRHSCAQVPRDGRCLLRALTDLTAPTFQFRSSPQSRLISAMASCPVSARSGRLSDVSFWPLDQDDDEPELTADGLKLSAD
jgi:hypothetical protein